MAYSRKQYLIKRSFQMRFMSRIFVVIVLIVSILSASFFVVNTVSLKSSRHEIKFFVQKITSINDEEAEKLSGAMLIFGVKKMGDGIMNSLDGLQRNMIYAFIGSVVLAMILTGTFFLLLSHRIAGPIYRIEKSIQGMQEGDLTMRIFLRDKDELTELAEQFNQMSATLNQKINLINQTVIQFQIDLEKENIDSEVRMKLIERIAVLEGLIKQFKTTYS